MEYKIKKVTEEIDVLEITEDEYQATNDMYKEAILNLGFPVNYVRDLKVKKVILTDGLHRKEFVLQVNENALKDKKADKEQIAKFNEDLKD
jgi:hypothetical protein